MASSRRGSTWRWKYSALYVPLAQRRGVDRHHGRRAFLEAADPFARHRVAFPDSPWRSFPLVREQLAVMTEARNRPLAGVHHGAARGCSRSSTRAAVDETVAGSFRVLVNASKHVISIGATDVARCVASKCSGGNGTIEDFSPLPRLLPRRHRVRELGGHAQRAVRRSAETRARSGSDDHLLSRTRGGQLADTGYVADQACGLDGRRSINSNRGCSVPSPIRTRRRRLPATTGAAACGVQRHAAHRVRHGERRLGRLPPPGLRTPPPRPRARARRRSPLVTPGRRGPRRGLRR